MESEQVPRSGIDMEVDAERSYELKGRTPTSFNSLIHSVQSQSAGISREERVQRTRTSKMALSSLPIHKAISVAAFHGSISRYKLRNKKGQKSCSKIGQKSAAESILLTNKETDALTSWTTEAFCTNNPDSSSSPCQVSNSKEFEGKLISCCVSKGRKMMSSSSLSSSFHNRKDATTHSKTQGLGREGNNPTPKRIAQPENIEALNLLADIAVKAQSASLLKVTQTFSKSSGLKGASSLRKTVEMPIPKDGISSRIKQAIQPVSKRFVSVNLLIPSDSASSRQISGEPRESNWRENGSAAKSRQCAAPLTQGGSPIFQPSSAAQIWSTQVDHGGSNSPSSRSNDEESNQQHQLFASYSSSLHESSCNSLVEIGSMKGHTGCLIPFSDTLHPTASLFQSKRRKRVTLPKRLEDFVIDVPKRRQGGSPPDQNKEVARD